MDIRHQILQSVYTLAQRQAIKDITVNDILAEATVSRGSFYKYFSDKYDVINSYYTEAMTAIFRDCDAYTWQGIFTKMLCYFETHAAFFDAAFRATGQNSFTDFFRQHLVTHFAAIIARHSTHRLTTDDQKALQFFADGFVAYTRQWALTGMQQAASELASDLHLFMPACLCEITLTAVPEPR
ncbi:MAG: TetR/AcrR family transcriptional regulator [Levilactobacillus sp.]|uniref:TetR/AcrR family transcriptional regulator n=1 Tax=Levilactobacillus sp. TaxID=2767919 RepID=UPI0025852FFF|nr:TetR/AcrR family transcriptional regulator [Levilactobacillus sp.]MCI1552839.1 TetR/AcrR family transcriptional regulator [Levilactobacillus sp.]MCI1597979.1 TetR/AcrR family transcriptional regulator [Levilactobacillus sp.]MCI1606709.1 TetR/AcrR family transcriptional regulator [Levilactobacillus sp.]